MYYVTKLSLFLSTKRYCVFLSFIDYKKWYKCWTNFIEGIFNIVFSALPVELYFYLND